MVQRKKKALPVPFVNVEAKFHEYLQEDNRDFIDYFYSQSGDAYVSTRRPIGQEMTPEEISDQKIWKYKKLVTQRQTMDKQMQEIEDVYKAMLPRDPLKKQFFAAKLAALEGQDDLTKRIYRKAYFKSPEIEFEEEFDSTNPDKCFRYTKFEGQQAVIQKGSEIKKVQEKMPVEHPEVDPLGSGLDTKFKQICVILGTKDDEIRQLVLDNKSLSVGQLIQLAKQRKLI